MKYKIIPKKSNSLNDKHAADAAPDLDLANWMGQQMTGDLAHVPLNQLAIPGTHDSFTYCVTSRSKISPDAATPIRYLVKLFGRLARRIVANWAKTQAAPTDQQLLCGIRYFDVRIVIRPPHNTPTLAHSLYCNALHVELRQNVLPFLESHPTEVVLLDFNHFYQATHADHQQIVLMLNQIFGSKLAPRRSNIYSLAEMWKAGHQVLVFYHDEYGESLSANMWSGSLMPSPYPETNSVDRMIQFLEKNYEQGRDMTGKFYVTQGILTETTADVIRHLTSTLKDYLARPARNALKHWLESKSSTQPNQINVTITDFAGSDDCDYIKLVISLNKRRKPEEFKNAFNTKLIIGK